MKKTTLVATLTLSALVLAGLAPTTHAAPNNPDPFPSTKTHGSLIFKTVGDDDEGEVTKPGTEGEIVVPGEGGSTTGSLRMTHVPNFDFGSVVIKTIDVPSGAIFETIKATENGVAVGNDLDIAHFAQVEDIRGKADGWSLSVKAGKFIPSDLTKNVVLEKSHIVLEEGKLFNTTKQDEIHDLVTILAPGSVLDTSDKGTATTIMKVNAGKDTGSSKTSVVFNNNYTKDDMVGGIPVAPAGESRLNPGVKIISSGTDVKAVDETYTAELLWTLTAGY